ncbi:TonB-dependent receptor [Maribellus maritimus]|uniref:TonB-dependent receptor n=1 Tax=Maribellus maritimus TaxID=2870838 RepID=UPI001EEB9A68|nr:TonB-dependent receptor [Maribellus maritimus]MCG6189383.1 TonB-dependent receptor [Maribellus maritimus]
MAKLTILLILISFMQISAKVYAQAGKLDVKVKDVSILQVFEEIESNSDYRFFYDNAQVDLTKKVSIDTKQEELGNVLNELFKGTDLTYQVKDRLILVQSKNADTKISVSSQQKSVSGTVTDESGQPLPGVTVIIKGSTQGTVTNNDGNYIINNIPNGATLQFSFVGMETQEVEVGNQSTIDVSMGVDAIGIEEVVAIGYGVVKKRDLTGAVSKVKADELSAVPVSRVDQALQGKSAGVQVTSTNGSPGAGTTIRIRGGNSISASNEPLFVVDGFIGAGDLNTINPNDIESVEILKDASATAIYGARGANGVVLITTKKGSDGATKVNINSSYGFQELPREIELLNGPQRAEYANEQNTYLGQEIQFPDISAVANTNWQKEVSQVAPIANMNLSISGGNEKAKYFFSSNYFDQEGVIQNSGYKRYQTRLNVDLKPFKWLSFEANMNLSRTNKNNSAVSWYDLLKQAKTLMPVYNEDGSYVIEEPLNGELVENPVAVVKMKKNNTYLTRFLGNWSAIASFENGLTFKSTLGIDLTNSKQNQYQPAALPVRSNQEKGGWARIDAASGIGILNENTINYLKDFGDHSFGILAGATIQTYQNENFWAKAEGFTNDVFEFNKLSAGIPELRDIESGFNDWRMVSFLSRANYSYKGKYLFTASVRRDGSSRLAANNKWATFPSAAFAWRASEEPFIQDLDYIHNLKFRLSYGKTGNQAISTYSTLATLAVASHWFKDGAEVLGFRQGNIPNPDLKWETTDQYDIGVDLSVFKGKLSLEADYYYKKTYDLLLSVEIPGTTGYGSRINNVGEVKNKGAEFLVSGVIFDNRDFKWNASVNISFNRNEAVDLATDNGYRKLSDAVYLFEGEPASVFYGLKYEGVWKDQAEIDANPNGYVSRAGYYTPGFPKYKDVNENGTLDGFGDYEIIGNPQPKFFGGFSSKLSYKRFDLDMYFNGSYGNDILNPFSTRLFFGGFATNISKDALNRWTETNTHSNIPRAGAYPSANVNTSEYSICVRDGSFLRLQTLRFTYNIPTQGISWLNRASVYFAGSNLWLLTNYKYGYDPEVNTAGTNPVQRGIDNYGYPQNRSYVIGVNLEF